MYYIEVLYFVLVDVLEIFYHLEISQIQAVVMAAELRPQGLLHCFLLDSFKDMSYYK